MDRVEAVVEFLGDHPVSGCFCGLCSGDGHLDRVDDGWVTEELVVVVVEHLKLNTRSEGFGEFDPGLGIVVLFEVLEEAIVCIGDLFLAGGFALGDVVAQQVERCVEIWVDGGLVPVGWGEQVGEGCGVASDCSVPDGAWGCVEGLGLYLGRGFVDVGGGVVGGGGCQCCAGEGGEESDDPDGTDCGCFVEPGGCFVGAIVGHVDHAGRSPIVRWAGRCVYADAHRGVYMSGFL